MTALAIGDDDYRASLTMFFSSPLSANQIDRERRRAADAGLGFQVTDTVMREDIESAAPPSLTIKMEGVGNTDKTNSWTSSGWPTWWEPETTYAFSDGRDLESGENFPDDAISAKDWKARKIIRRGTRERQSLKISGNARNTLYSTPKYGWQTAMV